MSEKDKNKGLTDSKMTDKEEKESKKRGRKGKYYHINENLDKIIKLYGNGWTDKEVADFFGINPSTLHDYKKKFKTFSASISKAKMEPDNKVIESLFKRALGYDYTEETIEAILDESGKPTKLKLHKKVKKHIPASEAAIRLWLINRLPDKFRNKFEIDNNIKIPWDKLSTTQLVRILSGEPIKPIIAELGLDGININ